MSGQYPVFDPTRSTDHTNAYLNSEYYSKLENGRKQMREYIKSETDTSKEIRKKLVAFDVKKYLPINGDIENILNIIAEGNANNYFLIQIINKKYIITMGDYFNIKDSFHWPLIIDAFKKPCRAASRK